MYSITVGELSLTAPFALMWKWNDYIQAPVTLLIIDFFCCHKPTGFSTGPDERRYTHWKQTVFYLENGEDDGLNLKKDEQIDGSMSIRPNARNIRDFDTTVKICLKVNYSQWTRFSVTECVGLGSS
ncbi:Protein arginine N-methyltransferase 8 [Fasciolopsis buskii]|uniref:Protein arginine N-methyltransferase 8 n=1 Tax=Fasciolopsis buskii TaxID=27845 RepID=A0A8E0RM31_9TREM|nr:Protein arginine N-methyltransferase 8 [Fasciolopsis buski]